MITIRAAVRADADAIAAAHIDGWRVGYRHLLPDDYLDAPSFAAQRLERWRAWTWANNLTGSQVFVPVHEGAVVGFAHCGAERAQPTCDQSGTADAADVRLDRGEVYGFYLHSGAWGSGAATALMARCVEHLAEDGFADAALWVLRDNPRARGFYEKTGWSPTGRTLMFAGPQTVQMPSFDLPEVEYARLL